MDDKCFTDLTAPEQTTVCNQLATVQKVTQDEMFKALGVVNPTIEESGKITWTGFCLVTGYIMASAKLPYHTLEERRRSCKSDFQTYQQLN